MLVGEIHNGYGVVGLEAEAGGTGVHQNYIFQLSILILDTPQILDIQIPKVDALILIDSLCYVLAIWVKII